MNLEAALNQIAGLGTVEKKSSVYETKPWGLKEQPNFLNQVAQIETGLEPLELLKELKKIERVMGRKKTVRYGPRLIDLDILFYEDLILRTRALVIPHPLLAQRAFVLVPLNEIEPELIHPLEKKSIHDLLAMVDCNSVWKWKEDL